MSSATDLVRREIELYREVSEVWKADHEDAMACYDFQDLLAKGIAAFEAVGRLDEAFRRKVMRNEVPYDPTLNDQITELYRLVFEPCPRILEKLSIFERAGFKVDAAEAFRSYCGEVKGILTDPAVFFSDDHLVEMRDDAIDANQRGDVSEYVI